MKRYFEDHVAWVTGGGSGIGRAAALELARRGAKVAVSGRRLDKLQGVIDDIEKLGGQGAAIQCDVQDPEQIDAADWRRQLETNVIGTALTARAALPYLRDTKGRIGLIGSVAAFICSRKLGAYNASKHAVRAIGQTLSVELAGTGVSCSTIHPGYVDSEIAQVDKSGHYDPNREDKRPKNLMWPAEKAAEVIVHALYKRKRELVFSGHGKVGAFIGQHLPSIAHIMMVRT